MNHLFLTFLTFVISSLLGVLALGDAIYLHLLKEGEPTTLSAFSYTIPVLTLFIGWQFLGEAISLSSFLGSAFIIIGVYLVNRA